LSPSSEGGHYTTVLGRVGPTVKDDDFLTTLLPFLIEPLNILFFTFTLDGSATVAHWRTSTSRISGTVRF
jgi:hypothetical protein